MSVEIDPSELGFRRPFTVEVAQILKIKNPNSQPVAFKVKTTAPKQYCVRPNSGRIEPNHEVEVTVLLQAMKQDLPADAKCKDKFLVQSVLITGDKEFATVQEIWDKAEKAAIQEKKIRVSFLPAQSLPQPATATTPLRQQPPTNGVEATPDPPAYASPEPETIASQPQPASQQEPSIEAKKEQPDAPPASAAAPAADVTPVFPKAAAALPVERMKEQVQDVKNAISYAVDDSGLKQRRPFSAKSDSSTAHATTADPSQVHPATVLAQPPVTEGVPVHIVALLCLISFLLAYFFF